MVSDGMQGIGRRVGPTENEQMTRTRVGEKKSIEECFLKQARLCWGSRKQLHTKASA
jgi:hypothetical protein